MANKINNNTYQKNMNMSLIAELIYKTGGIARADIARRLGLYRSTVTNIAGYLIDAGIVVEGETGESLPQGGRRPIVLKLNSSFGYIAGIDLQPSHYRLTFHDITGKLIEKIKGETPKMDFEGIIGYLMNEVIQYHEKTRLPLLGVGIGLPGIIDTSSGKIIYSMPMNLRDYDFKSFFESHWDVPYLIENDANCSAWHEAKMYPEKKSILTILTDYHEENFRFGDRNGVGIGLGLAINGEVYRGAHWSAGEFCSSSWIEGSPGQTGYSEEWLSGMISDKEKKGLWLRDICDSLKPVCSVIDPAMVVITGAPIESNEFDDEELLKNTEGFEAVLKKFGIALMIDRSHSCVARGAAAMMLSSLFDTENITEDWTELMTGLTREKSYVK